MNEAADELVFVPLGGLGEIGMNAALYGFGPPRRRKWIMVDLGLSFAGPDLPGIDIVLPDLSFVEKIRKDLLGLIITHAHEDHIGAVADLWPRLGCPLHATRFAAGLLETRRLSEPGAPQVPIHIVMPGDPLELGPFSLEFIGVAHSIPEATSLAVRTPAGLIIHTGDWKIDPTPVVGWPTDEARVRALGDEGVLALICDSTNIMRDGVSPSETDVAHTLRDIIASAPARVVVTTFASNVARLRSVAEAAQAAGRAVVVVGRAMERVVDVARECGYLDGIKPFFSADSYSGFDRAKVVLLATGSQGEQRAAMARIAKDEHPAVHLAAGDRVIFSSRTIPGNERGVNEIINGLIDQGVEVVTDRTHLVHVSGHPRRAEVARMYEWVRPTIAIPAHGEPLHLNEHAAFAATHGVKHVIKARNGDTVLLSPGAPAVTDKVPHGKLLKDGDVVVAANDEAVASRRKLAFGGVISIGMALDKKGDLAGDPDVVIAGIPEKTKSGKPMDSLIDKAIFDTFDHLPRGRRRDADAVAQSIERAVRAVIRDAWGKKPVVHVLVMEV